MEWVWVTRILKPINFPDKTPQPAHEAGNISREAAELFIDDLVSNPELRSLAELYGLDGAGTDNYESLDQLKKLSNENWDFRNGKERQEAAETSFNEEETKSIIDAANALGMIDSSSPQRDSYDFCTVLGGANRAPLLRVQYAREQIDNNGVKVPYIILLGSSRPLSDLEREKTSDYAPGAQDEFDLMNGAVETVFGVVSDDEETIDLQNSSPKATDRDRWRVRYYEASDGTKILSVSAPQIEGEKRVNTADTYRFMHDIVGSEMLQGSSILVVTSAIFVPFQHADALRLLGVPAKAQVETIGYDANYGGQPEREPQALLQEINSTLNQTKLLADKLVKPKEL